MVAVITGATKGVGKALAFSLAKRGYSLALSARDEVSLTDLKTALSSVTNQKIINYACDLSKKENALNFAEKVLAEFNQVDVLINNVGKYNIGRITNDHSDLESMIDTNLNSAFYLSKKIAPKMHQYEKGHIFNICSVLSFSPRIDAATYTISKHALKGFNDVLREEMREYNIKVTAIYPGSINTSSWEGIVAPKEKFVQPEDICKIVNTCLDISEHANIEEIIVKPLDKNY